MNVIPRPVNEDERLKVLHQYSILDSEPEEAFDALTRLAARLCGTPIALVSFIDERRQWVKSQVGWRVTEIPREHSLCAHTILKTDLLVIEDAKADPRYAAHPMVAGAPHLRFYAGAPLVSQFYVGVPLITPEGHALGTLCVIDRNSRHLTEDQLESLRALARQVVSQLELRRRLLEEQARLEQTEQALKESEGIYTSLVENLPQNVFRKDLHGRFTFANQRFCQTVGKSLHEILGRTDSDLYPAELAQKYQADDRKILETLQPCETVEENFVPGRGKVYVQVVKTAIRDLRGRVIGIQGIFWDVTERRKIEDELAYKRDLLQAFLDHIPDSIYFKDIESRFLTISRALAAKLGLPEPEAAAGKTDFEFFSREHAEQAYRDEQLIVSSGQPLVAKPEKERWPDGRETWVLTTKVPLRTKSGAIIGTFGISRDITKLKRTEEELALARDAALESARLKSEFLANMSHEIRTPLNAIVGMTGLLLDTPMQEEQRDYAETVRASADALLDIINDILDFSKIEAGKLAMETVDFSVRDVVEGSVELLAEAAQAKEIELVSWVRQTIPKVLSGDPGRLRQVLTNLLGNAVKFTEHGEVVLDVVKESETERHVILKFAVRDTGIGIAPDAHARLFQAFTQADGSLTRKYGGTGLGLAISKQLVEMMQGQIGFSSSPGQGSTFWFTARFEKPVRTVAILDREERGNLTGIRVLIVDDNATNRQILHHQIISWKMRNGSAGSGPEALEILRREALAGDPYQIVILDMQMPEMDGFSVARAIRADALLKTTRILVLTSLGHHPAPHLLKDLGIGAFLIKPVKQSRLFDSLANVLNAPTRGPIQNIPVHPQEPLPAIADLRGARILLAEDNSVNQKVALRQLSKLGYKADAAANGLEVLQLMEQVAYDIIFMDCQMPELDGYGATRQIRQKEATAHSKPFSRPHYIIAMTANALAGDRDECLAAGMNDYLRKPVRLDELNLALHRAALFFRQLAEPAAPDPDPLDLAVLEGLRSLRVGDEPDPLIELIDLFLADTPVRLDRIGQAIDAGDPTGLEAAAHSLKGSASNLGARKLADQCAEIVRLASTGAFTGAIDTYQKVQSEFERVRNVLERERQR